MLQVILNNAGRFISGLGKRAKTIDIMKMIGWMTITELRDYHSLIFLWRIKNLKAPLYLVDKINISESGKMTMKNPPLINSTLGLRWRSTVLWNKLREEQILCASLPRFKKAVKIWILEKRSPDPGDK